MPVSCTMGESLTLALTLESAGRPAFDLRGEAEPGLRFARDDVRLRAGPTRVTVTSGRPLPRRVQRLSLAVRWSAPGGEPVSPATAETVVYATMGPPQQDQEATVQEDGVTVKRMERAVSWVEPLPSQSPHAIVKALMGKFPDYALRPSPKVPRKYHHPTYFNDEGGAWAMSDHVAETGECQAIVRLVRGMLRQLGVPGQARTLLVWADPEVDDGKTPVTAYADEDPGAGLDRTKLVHGRRWLAALVDRRVEEGVTYPASHTRGPDDKPSPGFNRFEACLEFTHEGVTRLYGGGAGVFHRRERVLRAFWGLVWLSEAPHDGFRVEQIVRRYGGGDS